jgi:hypothetical protein
MPLRSGPDADGALVDTLVGATEAVVVVGDWTSVVGVGVGPPHAASKNDTAKIMLTILKSFFTNIRLFFSFFKIWNFKILFSRIF